MKTVTVTLNNKEYTAKLNLASRLEVKKEIRQNIEDLDFNEEENSYKVLHCILKANNKTYKLSYAEFLDAAPMTIIMQFADLMTIEGAPTETPEAGNVEAANPLTP